MSNLPLLPNAVSFPMQQELPSIADIRRFPAPAVTPQALAWHAGKLWMGSRDLRRIYAINCAKWDVEGEAEAPGIPWAAVSTGSALQFTLGEGPDDDRYLRSYVTATGFGERRVACPDFTGSYLSFDGRYLYLSQWYEHRILKLDEDGKPLRTIDLGAEICGHVWLGEFIYVLRGTEQDGEHWHIARLDPRQEIPHVKDLAQIPFPCRSLAFDGKKFWTNHRAGNEIVSFSLADLGGAP